MQIGVTVTDLSNLINIIYLSQQSLSNIRMSVVQCQHEGVSPLLFSSFGWLTLRKRISTESSRPVQHNATRCRRIIYLVNIIYYIHKNPRNLSGVNPSLHGTLTSSVSVKRMFTISIRPCATAWRNGVILYSSI